LLVDPVVWKQVRSPLLDRGRVGGDRILEVEHRLLLLDVQLNQRRGFDCNVLAFGHDRTDRLTLPHDLRVGQHRLVQRPDPDQAEDRVPVVRDVLRGDDRGHPRQRLGLARIHAAQHTAGDRAAHRL
jgi:hypothetical protein